MRLKLEFNTTDFPYVEHTKTWFAVSKSDAEYTIDQLRRDVRKTFDLKQSRRNIILEMEGFALPSNQAVHDLLKEGDQISVRLNEEKREQSKSKLKETEETKEKKKTKEKKEKKKKRKRKEESSTDEEEKVEDSTTELVETKKKKKKQKKSHETEEPEETEQKEEKKKSKKKQKRVEEEEEHQQDEIASPPVTTNSSTALASTSSTPKKGKDSSSPKATTTTNVDLEMIREIPKKPCKFFARGNCKNGAKCQFAHIGNPQDALAEAVPTTTSTSNLMATQQTEPTAPKASSSTPPPSVKSKTSSAATETNTSIDRKENNSNKQSEMKKNKQFFLAKSWSLSNWDKKQWEPVSAPPASETTNSNQPAPAASASNSASSSRFKSISFGQAPPRTSAPPKPLATRPSNSDVVQSSSDDKAANSDKAAEEPAVPQKNYKTFAKLQTPHEGDIIAFKILELKNRIPQLSSYKEAIVMSFDESSKFLTVKQIYPPVPEVTEEDMQDDEEEPVSEVYDVQLSALVEPVLMKAASTESNSNASGFTAGMPVIISKEYSLSSEPLEGIIESVDAERKICLVSMSGKKPAKIDFDFLSPKQ